MHQVTLLLRFDPATPLSFQQGRDCNGRGSHTYPGGREKVVVLTTFRLAVEAGSQWEGSSQSWVVWGGGALPPAQVTER